MCCSQFAQSFDRGNAGLAWSFRVVDVTDRDFHGDVRSAAERGELHGGYAPLSGCRQAKRRVGRDCRRYEDWPAPAGGFEEPVQPPRREWLRIERDEPRECTDLSPHVSDLPSYEFCRSQILRSTTRDPAQEERYYTESRRSSTSLCKQTGESCLVAAVTLEESRGDIPTSCLELRPWRAETVSYLLADLGGPLKRVVRQVAKERNKVKERLPRTQRR